MRIRAGRGLGDSIYLRPIVDHFVKRASGVRVASNYPDVFLGSGAVVDPFTRSGHFDRVANYTHTMACQDVTQFNAMCLSVGLFDRLDLSFAWRVRNHHVIENILERSGGRKVILVHGGRIPMQRGDEWAKDLMPRREAFCAALESLDDFYRVRIGNDRRPYSMPVDEDLNGETSVSDLLDLACLANGFIAQCSFCVPLAEAFNKPLLAIWSAKGLRSQTEYLRHVTPRKVLQRKNGESCYVMDDDPMDSIADAARKLFDPPVNESITLAA